mmetsp:Transcript_4590/g.8665  ORF Transcript_4590/g.8665 Transcript_4590/m.8665 type:complete len:206 (+) Transcript_4590:339-956(+)
MYQCLLTSTTVCAIGKGHVFHRLSCQLCVMSSQLICALNALALEDPSARRLDVAGGFEFSLDERLQARELLRRKQHGRGGEAGAQVVERGLAQNAALGGEVEHVVHDLERQAQVAAVLKRQEARLGRMPAHHRHRLGGVRKERARLVKRLLHVRVPAKQRIRLCGDLHHLPLHQVVQHGRHQPHRLGASQLRKPHRRARQQEVAP